MQLEDECAKFIKLIDKVLAPSFDTTQAAAILKSAKRMPCLGNSLTKIIDRVHQCPKVDAASQTHYTPLPTSMMPTQVPSLR